MNDAVASAALQPSDDSGRTEHDLTFDELSQLLPHRQPFVLIDRVVALDPGRSIRCVKNVTAAESVFASHFPGRAIFPGAFLLEAMAQATLLLLHQKFRAAENGASETVPVLASARIRWLKPVRPGDQLIISAASEKMIVGAAVVRAQACVGADLVARATLTIATARLDR